MASFTRLHVPLFDSKHSGLVAARQGCRPACAQHNHTGKYSDPEFPATQSSVWKRSPSFNQFGRAEASMETETQPMAVWCRPEQFYHGRSYKMFEGSIEPNDINQGSLGNCWFMCAVAALAEFPELIIQLFQMDSRAINDAGRYNVCICESGAWKNYTVDDLFPCSPQGGNPLFATGHGNELWVQILEKVYAKVCGSYKATDSGFPFEGLLDLTGAPYTSIRLEGEEAETKIRNGTLWKTLKRNDDLGYLQTASTWGTDTLTIGGDRHAGEGSGLVPGHAYALIQVKSTQNGTQLLQLRNPWGAGGMEWTGAWSDHDRRWTNELRRELNYTIDKNDGLFWMEFSDFVKQFMSVDCVMIKHQRNGAPWFESRKPITFRMDPAMMPGFVSHSDPATGKTYYVNTATNATQWNFPAALPAGWTAHSDTTSGKIYYVNESTSPPTSFWDPPAASTSDLAVEAPMYVMVLEQPVEEAFFSVHQRDIRCLDAQPYIDFGVTVMRYNPAAGGGGGGGYELVAATGNSADRQNQTEGVPLAAGQYLVVPTSTGVVLKNRSPKSCVATVVVHTSGPHSLLEQPFHPSVYEEAIELPIIEFGKATTLEADIVMYKLNCGFSGTSFVVKNSGAKSVKITHDCSSSVNAQSNQFSLRTTQILPPGEAKVTHHVAPLGSYDTTLHPLPTPIITPLA